MHLLIYILRTLFCVQFLTKKYYYKTFGIFLYNQIGYAEKCLCCEFDRFYVAYRNFLKKLRFVEYSMQYIIYYPYKKDVMIDKTSDTLFYPKIY